MSTGNREIIVIIIDNNEIYWHSLVLLLKSAALNSKKLLEKEWVVLCPTGDYPQQDLKKYKSDIQMIQFPVPKTEDVYALKFLIINYICNCEADISAITYMDADHIIFNEVKLPAIEPGTVYLSSEKNDVRTKSMGMLTDYNTSFIRADVKTWKKVMHEWRKWYDILENQDVMRFREEIAFSCAAKHENIIIRQVGSELQSNFQVPNINCAMFHYGGDYPAAKKLKGLLGDL